MLVSPTPYPRPARSSITSRFHQRVAFIRRDNGQHQVRSFRPNRRHQFRSARNSLDLGLSRPTYPRRPSRNLDHGL